MAGKATAKAITVERVRELLHFEPTTGVFTWRVSSNGVVGGRVAGNTSHGYVRITVAGCACLGHRLALFYVHGIWPNGEIDHINGEKSDNRIENLRDVTCAANVQNKRRANANNVSFGMLGVTFDKKKGRIVAQIGHRGKHIFLGRFDSPEVAHAAYISAKRQLHEGNTL